MMGGMTNGEMILRGLTGWLLIVGLALGLSGCNALGVLFGEVDPPSDAISDPQVTTIDQLRGSTEEQVVNLYGNPRSGSELDPASLRNIIRAPLRERIKVNQDIKEAVYTRSAGVHYVWYVRPKGADPKVVPWRVVGDLFIPNTEMQQLNTGSGIRGWNYR